MYYASSRLLNIFSEYVLLFSHFVRIVYVCKDRLTEWGWKNKKDIQFIISLILRQHKPEVIMTQGYVLLLSKMYVDLGVKNSPKTTSHD